MKLKVFPLLLFIFDSNCLGMEKLMTDAYRLCNLPLQIQYARAHAGYFQTFSRSEPEPSYEGFLEYALENKYFLVAKDMLSRYEKSQEAFNILIAKALRNEHNNEASDWISLMVQTNKWDPNKFRTRLCSEDGLVWYKIYKQGTKLLINYGIACNDIDLRISEHNITEKKLKDIIFLLKFTKKIAVFGLTTPDILAIQWIFNPQRFTPSAEGFSYKKNWAVSESIELSETELDQLVINKAAIIGLPDIKIVDDVKKQRALWLKFKTEKLDAIRDEAIENNKYPIDWEREFEKFKEIFDRPALYAAIKANRITNFINYNPKNAHINYLISLNREKVPQSFKLLYAPLVANFSVYKSAIGLNSTPQID
jgi:hypothetical protein